MRNHGFFFELASLFLFVAILTVFQAPSASGSWSYRLASSEETASSSSGELTVIERSGQHYVPLKQFCGSFKCSVVYNWDKHRAVISHSVGKAVHTAILSHLTSIAVIEGEVFDFQPEILALPGQGYAIPIVLAQKLAVGLSLGQVFEKSVRQEVSIEDPVEKAPNILVLDPGHGGNDLGTGVGALYEKDISLIYALALKAKLAEEIPDLKVLLTREEDRFVSLADRAHYANSKKAELFLSIHVNHAANGSIHGAETFILSPEATDNDSKKTALLENEEWIKNIQPNQKSPTPAGLQKIFVDLEQQKFIQRSAQFAAYIQQELSRINEGKEVKNRGVKQAYFYVLSQAAMPSVLVEMGFLSHDGDRARLMNLGFRDQFVKSLVTAIRRYRIKLGGH